MDRASDYGSEGLGFESLQVHRKSLNLAEFQIGRLIIVLDGLLFFKYLLNVLLNVFNYQEPTFSTYKKDEVYHDALQT